MKRPISLEEIKARVGSGDRSFLRWLRSAERREQLGTTRQRAANRFIIGYWSKAFGDTPGMHLVLHIGSGMGALATAVARRALGQS